MRFEAHVRALLVVFACALAVVFSACGNGESESGESAEAFDYTLPSGWNDESGQVDEIAANNGLEPGSVQALAAMESASPYAPVFLVITPSGLDGLSLSRFASSAVAEAKRGVRQRVGQTLQGNALPDGVSSVGRPERTAVGGEPAMRFDFEGTSGGVSAKVRNVVVIHDDVRYLLRFVSSNFGDDVGDFDDILSSWRWT